MCESVWQPHDRVVHNLGCDRNAYNTLKQYGKLLALEVNAWDKMNH